MGKIRRTGKTLNSFIKSEKSGGIVLIICTIISLFLANSSIGESYISIWHLELANHSLSHWINDGLMAIFFLLIGLELIEEVQEGELSNIKTALLPISAALGGMLVPACIFLLFNFGSISQAGFGIPMATDIAFALGVLSLLGKRVPLSLKVFLTALAVIDDLGAIIVIAIFYTTTIAWTELAFAIGIFVALLILNKVLGIKNMLIYLIGGIFMWYFMLHSGIHATIAGVLLAIAMPYKKGESCPSKKLQHLLHYPVAFIILPLFAAANTAMVVDGSWSMETFNNPLSLGIIGGLIIGKPLGITLFSFLSVKTKLCALPKGCKWKEILGISILGGIGFTMSIFITLLAFSNAEHLVDNAKLMILLASLTAGIGGYVYLHFTLKPKHENKQPKVRH